MKWFKHYSDNHRGMSVNKLLDELGYFGPFFYYTIYELCAEKLEKLEERALCYDDMVFTFHRRVVCSATRAKPTSVERGLVLGQSCGLWSFSTSGDFFEIKVPMLLDLLESDQKKSRSNRVKNALRSSLDKDIDKDKDTDIGEVNAGANLPDGNFLGFRDLTSAYNWIMTQFNSIVAGKGNVKPEAGFFASPKMLDKFQQIISYKFFSTKENWLIYFERVSKSDFLLGISEKKNVFKVTLLWVLDIDNAQSILAGQYDNTESKNEAQFNKEMEELRLKYEGKNGI